MEEEEAVCYSRWRNISWLKHLTLNEPKKTKNQGTITHLAAVENSLLKQERAYFLFSIVILRCLLIVFFVVCLRITVGSFKIQTGKENLKHLKARKTGRDRAEEEKDLARLALSLRC